MLWMLGGGTLRSHSGTAKWMQYRLPIFCLSIKSWLFFYLLDSSLSDSYAFLRSGVLFLPSCLALPYFLMFAFSF